MEMPSDIFFHLPVPFVKGDLITFDDGKPYVLRDIPQWEDRYEDFVRGKARDGSDMCAFVFYLRDDILESDNGPPYMTWEMRYYKSELREQERFLKYLSSFIRNKYEDLAWLISVFMRFYTEAKRDDWASLFDSWYRPLEAGLD